MLSRKVVINSFSYRYHHNKESSYLRLGSCRIDLFSFPQKQKGRRQRSQIDKRKCKHAHTEDLLCLKVKINKPLVDLRSLSIYSGPIIEGGGSSLNWDFFRLFDSCQSVKGKYLQHPFLSSSIIGRRAQARKNTGLNWVLFFFHIEVTVQFPIRLNQAVYFQSIDLWAGTRANKVEWRDHKTLLLTFQKGEKSGRKGTYLQYIHPVKLAKDFLPINLPSFLYRE